MTFNSGVAQNEEIGNLNDDFTSKTTLSKWLTHHETEGWPDFTDKVEINEEEGVFHIEPNTTGWYGDFHRGPFYFKTIRGDFTVKTRIKVTGKNTTSPKRGYSLAGLMVRSPRPNVAKDKKGVENWLFLSTGSAKKKGQAEFETKNTVNGKSKLKVFEGKSGWITLAISRIGNTFYQFYNYDNAKEWVLLRVMERPEMPEEVQVGMLAYSDFWSLFTWFLFKNRKKFNTKAKTGKPDLIAKFDFIHFKRPKTDSDVRMKNEKEYHNEPISKKDTINFSLE